MSIYGSFAQQSRPALHLRGAYTSARTPYHQPNPFESRSRTWMHEGHAETPLYGWSWPPDNYPSWSHDWPSTETTVRRHCLSLLSYSIVLPSRTPRSSTLHTLHYSSSPYSRLTILLCTTSLSCWHTFPFTIVIHHNHQRDPASRYNTFLLRTLFSAQQHPTSLHNHATGWQSLEIPAEHPPRLIQTFGILHRHVISREPTAIPESCAAIRLRWQP